MTGRFVIVASFQDGASEGVICGDIDAAFVGKDAGLDLPVSQARTEGERDILIDWRAWRTRGSPAEADSMR